VEAIHSNGAAYGDLNNDGSLDLVVSNVNKPASIFKNMGRTLSPENHFIQLKLEGKGANTAGIGSTDPSDSWVRSFSIPNKFLTVAFNLR